MGERSGACAWRWSFLDSAIRQVRNTEKSPSDPSQRRQTATPSANPGGVFSLPQPRPSGRKCPERPRQGCGALLWTCWVRRIGIGGAAAKQRRHRRVQSEVTCACKKCRQSARGLLLRRPTPARGGFVQCATLGSCTTLQRRCHGVAAPSRPQLTAQRRSLRSAHFRAALRFSSRGAVPCAARRSHASAADYCAFSPDCGFGHHRRPGVVARRANCTAPQGRGRVRSASTLVDRPLKKLETQFQVQPVLVRSSERFVG